VNIHTKLRQGNISYLYIVAFSSILMIAAQTIMYAATPAATVDAAPLAIETTGESALLHVVVGHSVLLQSADPLRRIYIGNPAVLESFTSSPTQVVITAKEAGNSSLVLWDNTGSSRLYTIYSDIDPKALQGVIQSAFPLENINVEAKEDKIYLSGTVPTVEASDAAVKLASLYSKSVANSLRVIAIHGKQVQLKLRIVEVDRTKMEQFGLNFFTGTNSLASISTGQFGSTGTITGSTASVSDPLNIFLYSSALKAGVTIKDLEQKDILQILAEPTLTTMSGMPAKFLSGGEFPVPVVQGGTGASTAISIMFRPYGVKVDFTPTVNEDGTIRLKVAPEVSTLDFTNAVTISGFTIPALSTRRAETEVELRDGQSFLVSGLLDHRTTEIMSQVPGISSIPILGQFFRSKDYKHSVVELVVIVTVSVVDPLQQAAPPPEPMWAVPNLEAAPFDSQAKKKP